MRNFKFLFLLAISGLMVIFFSCKRKIPATENSSNTQKPISDSSYFLKGFLITDGADSKILDFADVHQLIQHDTTAVHEGILDTIIFSILNTNTLDQIKVKPLFTDASLISSVDPDTTKVSNYTNDGTNFPTLQITYNTGLIRTFVIVASTTEGTPENINLLKNQNIYYISDFNLQDGANPITNYTPVKFTHHNPVFAQSSIKDTIELMLSSTFRGSSVTFSPTKWGNNNTDTVNNTVKQSPSPFVINASDFGTYKTLICTFANGFKREYAVMVTKPQATDISFDKFSVVESGITYAKKDTMIIAGDPTADFVKDSTIILVRSLEPTKWTNGRKVTLKFEGLATTVIGSLNSYNTVNQPSKLASLNANGTIEVDFTNIPSDSVQLTLENPPYDKKNYKIKLLSGINYKTITQVIDGTGANRDNANFSTSSYQVGTTTNYYDQEASVAVDEKYVYILKLLRNNLSSAPGNTGANVFSDFSNGTISILAYDINSGSDKVATGNGITIKMPPSSDNTAIVTIFSVNNILYAIAVNKAGGASYNYYVYKWTDGVSNDPYKYGTGTNTINSVHLPISNYQYIDESGVITLITSPIGGNHTTGSSFFQIKLGTDGTTWTNGVAGTKPAPGNLGNASFIGDVFINSISTGVSLVTMNSNAGTNSGGVYYMPNNWSNATSDISGSKGFLRYSNASDGGTPGLGVGLLLMGGNIHTIRDKDYLVSTEAVISQNKNTGQGGAIFDFGKSIKTTLDTANISWGLFPYRKKHFEMPSSAGTLDAGNYYYRGGCRTYVMRDGTIRVAYLINGVGFKVYDIK